MPTGVYIRTESYRKIMSKAMKGRKVTPLFGNKNGNWRGGKTSLNAMLRYSKEMKAWSREVFKRDNYTCQHCFVRGCYLEAHHVKKFSQIMSEFLLKYSQFSPIDDKEILIRLSTTYEPFWELSNGLSLCKPCHNKTKADNFHNSKNSTVVYGITDLLEAL